MKLTQSFRVSESIEIGLHLCLCNNQLPLVVRIFPCEAFLSFFEKVDLQVFILNLALNIDFSFHLLHLLNLQGSLRIFGFGLFLFLNRLLFSLLIHSLDELCVGLLSILNSLFLIKIVAEILLRTIPAILINIVLLLKMLLSLLFKLGIYFFSLLNLKMFPIDPILCSFLLFFL